MEYAAIKEMANQVDEGLRAPSPYVPAGVSDPDQRQFDLTMESDAPYAFIQWKGTDVCMDFHCDCGEHNHFDGGFAYVVKCAKCRQEWEMPIRVFPRKRCAATYADHEAKLMDGCGSA